MKNTCVYLIGPPGVGKYTVGKWLVEKMPARLVDNHFWNNPIFEIVEPDGRAALPDAVWDLTNSVRTAVLEAIATLAPPERNFIFTHAISRDAGHPWDRVIARQVLETAGRRGAATLVVRLSCGPTELARRIEAPDRALRLKERDGSRAEAYSALVPFDPMHPWTVALDTSGMTADDVSDFVISTLQDRPVRS